MTIISKDAYVNGSDRVIDLDCPDGNAFVLISIVKNTLQQLQFDKTYIDSVVSDMMSSDYDHLVRVADKEIGSIYTFIK